MGAKVDVSVVVPCYNVGTFVDQALTSAEQNGTSIEIIALDDGSQDKTPSILDAHGARDRRVRVVHKQNEGYGATVNRGMDLAQGTYVAILEPDDWVKPHAYDDLYALALANGMPDVVRASYLRVIGTEEGQVMRAYGYIHGRVRRLLQPIRLVDEPQLIQYHPAVWSGIYRRDYLVRNNIRFIECPGGGWVDNPFVVRALAMAQSIVCTDEAFYCYREDLSEASSASVDPLLMLTRWHDRQDVLDELGVEDAGVLRANTIVGLSYLSRMMGDGSLDVPQVRDAAERMACRINPSILRDIDYVSPAVIGKCLELAGRDEKRPGALPFVAHLGHEAAWALTNNGPRFFAHNIKVSHER